MFNKDDNPRKPMRGPDRPDFIRLKLTPSDQLLSIAVVNLILFGAMFGCLAYGFNSSRPQLPGWLSWGAVLLALTVVPGVLATSDSWLPGLVRILTGGNESADPDGFSENLIRGAVFLFSMATIAVLWEITDRTGGFSSPFVPFLTAPAVFSPFVARNWEPIAFLCATVIVCIVVLGAPPNEHFLSPADWTYKGVAAMMIVIAGTLTIVRLRVEKKGPLTGAGGSLSAEPEG